MHHPRKQLWAKLLRDLRIQRGVSTHKMSAETGIARSTIIHAEKGASTFLNTRMLERMLDYFGYDLEVLPRGK